MSSEKKFVHVNSYTLVHIQTHATYANRGACVYTHIGEQCFIRRCIEKWAERGGKGVEGGGQEVCSRSGWPG